MCHIAVCLNYDCWVDYTFGLECDNGMQSQLRTKEAIKDVHAMKIALTLM